MADVEGDVMRDNRADGWVECEGCGGRRRVEFDLCYNCNNNRANLVIPIPLIKMAPKPDPAPETLRLF